MSMWNSLRKKLTLNRQGDNHSTANFGVTVGVVVDTDDPLQMGRLRIYCPDLNDDPKKVQHLPWAAYVAPFGGSIRNNTHNKGHDKSTTTTSEGVTQYGFWGIPELGANVIVTCINGDPRRRVWMGCLYEQQEVGGLFHGVYDWGSGDGKVEGPLSAPEPDFDGDDTKNKIQPLYDNLSKAFNDKRNSAEWKTRGADYAGMVNVDIDTKGTHEELSNGEQDSWVKEKLGAAGYDWTSFKDLGSFLASKVFGFMSPGLHSISFDDRPFNSRIKLRTTAGHQIILDDTNERIYINTFEGKSWLEMDKAGNIDIFAERNISVNAEKDINFSTDESFRVKAKKGIFMYAGDKTGQSALDNKPANGQIRLHSQDDTHFMTEGNFFQHIKGDMDFTLDGDFTGIVSGEYNLEIETNTYNIVTPSNKIMINGSSVEIDTNRFTVDASSKVQLQGGSSAVRIASGTITLDAPSVGFNDFGTTVGLMTTAINALAGCATCPAGILVPIPQIVLPDTLNSPTINVEETEISPWTNRVPQHEPWPRVMKLDEGDAVNQKSDRPDYNVDWIDQFDNETPEGRKNVGKVEGDQTIERNDFWRR